MNTIKFALVIGLPMNETFGYLIIASYATIVFGAISYLIFVWRQKHIKSWSNYTPS